MNIKEMQCEIFQENEMKLRELMKEIEKYAKKYKLDRNQVMGIDMLCKVFLDLYKSIYVHYTTVINETSLNVVFRSFYESCLNNIYLYQESENLTFGKKLDIYTHAGVISVKQILKSQISLFDKNNADIIKNILEVQDEIISDEKFKDIKRNSNNEKGFPKNWYGYYTNIKSIRQLSEYVGLGTVHKQLYKYLSSDAHGNKVLGNTLNTVEKGEDEFIVYFSNVLALQVIESMNEFISLNGGNPTKLDAVDKKLEIISQEISL